MGRPLTADAQSISAAHSGRSRGGILPSTGKIIGRRPGFGATYYVAMRPLVVVRAVFISLIINII